MSDSQYDDHWYLFLDESGTAKEDTVPDGETFVLCGVLMSHRQLENYRSAAFDLKAKYWTYPIQVIFHARDIHRRNKAFDSLTQLDYSAFIHDLGGLVSNCSYTLLCGCIDGVNSGRKTTSTNPYHEAFRFVFERAYLNIKFVPGIRLTIVSEGRNPKQNNKLRHYVHELTFGAGSGMVKPHEYQTIRPTFVTRDKLAGYPGLELADLCAGAIRWKLRNPEKVGRHADAVWGKLRANPNTGLPHGWGFKIVGA